MFGKRLAASATDDVDVSISMYVFRNTGAICQQMLPYNCILVSDKAFPKESNKEVGPSQEKHFFLKTRNLVRRKNIFDACGCRCRLQPPWPCPCRTATKETLQGASAPPSCQTHSCPPFSFSGTNLVPVSFCPCAPCCGRNPSVTVSEREH